MKQSEPKARDLRFCEQDDFSFGGRRSALAYELRLSRLEKEVTRLRRILGITPGDRVIRW